MEPDASPTSTTSCSKQSKLPLALLTLECNSNKCFLFDPSTKQTRGATDMAAFFPDAATLAFENRGWLLMPPARENTANRLPVHAGNGRRVDLLVFRSVAGGLFVFHINSHGEPLVVACVETASDYPTILPRRRVVCADYRGRISVFDMTETAWRTPVPSPGWNWQEDHFLVTASGEGGGEEEEEEEVILVSCRRRDDRFCEFKFFKLDIAMAPSPLEAGDLDGFSWFLCRGRSSRLREEKGGRKVYTFCPDRLWGESRTIDLGNGKKRKMAPFNPRGLIEKSITNVYAHNLVDGVVEELLPASIVTEARHWVHSAVFSEPFA
uniref:Uncharacterized protein n=1 Tax=Oryza barthii TaxID=65489 RepID=A0A0D3GKH6_9ORYZ